MGNTCCCCPCSPSQEDYQNVISNTVAVEDMSHIDEMISYLDQLLNSSNEERQVAKTDRVDSSIKSGGGLLENVLRRANRHTCKRDFMPNLNREACKFAIDVTNQTRYILWVGVALAVVGFVLERIELISSNRKECIQLLKYMYDLAKYIKRLDEHLPQEKLNRVLQFIVKGSLMCISQIESDALSKFFSASVAAEDLRGLQTELGHEYSDLSLEAMIAVMNTSAAVLNRIPVVLPPSQGIYPQTVGIEEARNCVTELLDMKRKSVRVVVIYGPGGIGKTTLATAVFSKLDLKNYKYCRVDIEQNCSEADLKLLQRQILRDLFGHNIELRSLNEGREELSKDFKKATAPVFIFFDNALKESDLEKLLPISDLASLPAQSRILATTRNLNETRRILQEGIERCSYRVASLPQEEAWKLLCELSLGSGQTSFNPTIDIKGLLQICQGNPLVLKMVGARLREHAHSVAACRNTIEYLKSWLLQGVQGELSECMVDFVYNRLEASCKEAFLDIVFFFCNWKRCRVVFSVGETEFQELERAALVNITDKGTVNVHDIVKARGRMLSSDGERITDLQSLTDVLQDVERIKKIKGIVLAENFELEARHLNLMKRCLRVLILTRTRIVNGECKGAFENLRLLSLDYHNYSLMDVSKHPRMAVFIGKSYSELSSIPSSLKYMHVEGATLVNLTTTLSQLQSLRSLTLRDCRGFDSLPKTIGNLPALEKLDLNDCNSLVSLPFSVENLSGLEKLRLRGCSNLVSLPDSFGNLSSLKKLNLSYCSSLVSLSNNFGNLFSLVELNFYGCSRLVGLPDSFGNLSSLTKLNLWHCSRLVSLLDNFGNLFGLVELCLHGCSKLGSLPDSFGKLSSLKYLNLGCCSSLVNLSSNFGNLYGLVELDLNSCYRLVNLPDSFSGLSSLKKLNLWYCSKLVCLPNNFGNLFGLIELDLHFCSSLISLPDDFGNLSYLVKLNLRSCSRLVSLPNSFGNLSGLVELNLEKCSSLEILPHSFGNLSNLIKLNLKFCSSLVSLPESFGNLFSLKSLNLEFCSNLMNLPESFANLSNLEGSLTLDGCFNLISLPNSIDQLSSLSHLSLDGCTQLSVLPESCGNLASLELLILRKCEKLSNLPQNFGQLKCLKYVSIHRCRGLQRLSNDFECLNSLIAIKASECSQLEENTMDKLAKMKGLMIADIDGSPMLKKRWEQVKEQFSLAVVSGGRQKFRSEMYPNAWPEIYPYADVMSRAFFHSESKFLHVDENGQFGKLPSPAGGVKLWVLLTVCDLTLPSNSRYLEAVKKKWMEVVASEGGQMIYVEMGGLWEDSERAVRQTLPHLPRGTSAWIAPDSRARLLFAYSLFKADSVREYEAIFIASISTSVDEEGRRRLHDFDFIIPDYTPDFEGIECQDIFDQLFSPVLKAQAFLLKG